MTEIPEPEVVVAEVVPEPPKYPAPTIDELTQAIVGIGYQLSLLAARLDAIEQYLLDAGNEDE